MIKLEGKVNTAICYASIIEDDAIKQIRRMCDYDLSKGCKIRIMPDVHVGKGCTIGTTIKIKDKVCPNIVGVDIGCGMYCGKLKEKEIDLKKFDESCHYIPSGLNVWEGRIEKFDFTKLKCFRSLNDSKRLNRSLGTLGGGNHFIEIDKSGDGTLYLVIHSGSRNLGKQVAEIYQNLAIDLHKGKDKLFQKIERTIKDYKKQNRRDEIQDKIKQLKREFSVKQLDVPEDLCWLYGKYLKDYLHDIELCQDFAKRNRELIAETLLKRNNLTIERAFHTIHNYIDTKEKILRKGAISAHKKEKVLIPINMRDGSIIALGKGNKEWNYSAPHGAGRIYSRKQAKEKISLEDFKKSMEGIYSTTINESTIDESPMAYKSIDNILSDIKNSVDILDIIKPIYNFKAGDGQLPWKKKK